ncbi:MAG TPA: hypothetical protein VJU59_38505 [Paraburkholderia sp.]|nr:hypothetical protein [Paraburkholderia sp.]
MNDDKDAVIIDDFASTLLALPVVTDLTNDGSTAGKATIRIRR